MSEKEIKKEEVLESRPVEEKQIPKPEPMEDKKPVTEEQYNEILEALKDKIPILTVDELHTKVDDLINYTKELNLKNGITLADPGLARYVDLVREVEKLIAAEIALGNADVLKKYITGDLSLFSKADNAFFKNLVTNYIDLIQKHGFISHKILEFIINSEIANPAAAKLIAAQLLVTKVLNIITKDMMANSKKIIL